MCSTALVHASPTATSRSATVRGAAPTADSQRRIATRISLSDQGNAGTTRSNGPISPLSWRRARRCHRRSAAGAHPATPASDVLCRTLCRLPWVASARSSCSSHISPLSLRIAIQPGLDEPYSYYFQHALYAQAMLDWRNGLVPRALAALQRVSKRLLAMQAMEAAVFVLVDQAALAAEAQDAAAGEDAAAGLALLANDGGLAPCRAIVEVGLSWASSAAGEADAAAAHARHALDLLLSEQRLPFWTSRAHEALAHALLARDPAAALAAFEAAGRGFEPCGARWRQRRTYDAMRRVGSAGRRLAARAGGSALTRREREVARLAAQGHAARDIAEHLSITERTVEGHLSNIYAKLGVSSKLELVRTAQQLEL